MFIIRSGPNHSVLCKKGFNSVDMGCIILVCSSAAEVDRA